MTPSATHERERQALLGDVLEHGGAAVQWHATLWRGTAKVAQSCRAVNAHDHVLGPHVPVHDAPPVQVRHRTRLHHIRDAG